MSNRKYYLVGGAVRDGLLDYPYSEKDWVVTGVCEKEMLNDGFKKVGKDFPVFLHPETKEEYALARTERKSGHGYHGFEVNAEPSVTLEDDLSRRDLTINAMALDENDQLIDPFNGSTDLKNKKLRHISPAFAEDPVRVLRVARFAARYHHLGFSIADETITLMQQMVTEGEVEHLVAERVWQEMHKALTEKNPQVFISVLREIGALKVIMPEIDVLFGIPNPIQWHPEIDTGIHSLMVLKQAAKLTELPLVRFAALCHDLGKGVTPEKFWPKHRGHEEAGVNVIKRLCARLKPPKEFTNLACLGSRYHLHAHKAFELKPSTLLKLFQAFDLFRRPELFSYYLDICEADYRGRGGFDKYHYPQRKYLTELALKVAYVKLEAIIERELTGKEIGNALNKKRIQLITDVKLQFRD
ncbi:MAG: multifunctional CCA addition/repair protein [Gammaproteobacteria bacterium]|nr:multifunctional CCA addition/repair protein [Gammaproteobacteria bacterium]